MKYHNFTFQHLLINDQQNIQNLVLKVHSVSQEMNSLCIQKTRYKDKVQKNNAEKDYPKLTTSFV